MSSKPKLLFLLHLPPPIHGSSIVGMNIRNSILITKEFDCHFINLLASKNIAQTGSVSFRKVFDFFFIFIDVFILIIKKRPDLSYLALTSTGLAFYRDVILVLILKLFKIKRVYHLHNKGVSLHQNKIIYRLCYKFVFHGADVILLSKHLYSDIQDFVPESKIYICPNGIADETLKFPKLERKDHSFYSVNCEKSSIYKIIQILFLSNLIETKGLFTLLEACALLKKRGVLFKCIFIGSEGDVTASQFNDVVNQLGISNQVGYFGKRYGEEKQIAFAESDIFAFPTYYETFGLVNLEAMQNSMPIVATMEGGIPDIIDDNISGFLIPKKDPLALADKLELLINNDELRHQFGIAGRVKYESYFTLEKFEYTLTSIIRQIIRKQ